MIDITLLKHTRLLIKTGVIREDDSVDFPIGLIILKTVGNLAEFTDGPGGPCPAAPAAPAQGTGPCDELWPIAQGGWGPECVCGAERRGEGRVRAGQGRERDGAEASVRVQQAGPPPYSEPCFERWARQPGKKANISGGDQDQECRRVRKWPL